MEAELKSLSHFKATALDMTMKFGPKVLVALLIFAVGHFVGRSLGRWMDRSLNRLNLEPPLRILLVRIVRVLVFGLFSILALQNLGVELFPLIAGLGVIGAGIALGMQGVLGNIIAGLTIIFSRPFRVGDYLSIAHEEGEVLDISLFSTQLGHPDCSKVMIPNRKIVGEIMHNYGRIRQVSIVLNVAYSEDLDTVFSLIAGVLAANPRVVAEPKPIYGIQALGQSSIEITIRPWVKVVDYLPAIAEINRALLHALAREGIGIPVPQQEIRVLSLPSR